jgi:hypothetical protein
VGTGKMNKINDLKKDYARFKLGLAVGSAFIDWAIERLQANEEGNDHEVVLLASATTEDEALPLTETILHRYMADDLELESVAGKEIVNLRLRYLKDELSINDLDEIINSLFVRLNYPDWLVVLSRNCEYATDIDNFRKPFEMEFEYIARLWSASNTIEEFNNSYNRRISDAHTLPAN